MSSFVRRRQFAQRGNGNGNGNATKGHHHHHHHHRLLNTATDNDNDNDERALLSSPPPSLERLSPSSSMFSDSPASTFS
eukprot:CAMPEP_0113560166 /NCGR_PEP_ID=MMETSP0015_2-20120614/19283_1 /TAXON_ID=2838 /ORGANISM="Odontella" /LENGTH=78 /DNA_ID=CAMNT_0000461847 /DNA_START=661 /DNA_END=894 /DNA_ORIENTATION=- /assembly_acc=CAM_ASM_000160